MALPTPAYAVPGANQPLVPFKIERREPGPHDVLLDIQYCGVCHSDVHQARDEWGQSTFPMVPGHEIAGIRSCLGRRSFNLEPFAEEKGGRDSTRSGFFLLDFGSGDLRKIKRPLRPDLKLGFG